jgi:hypothetical protein
MPIRPSVAYSYKHLNLCKFCDLRLWSHLWIAVQTNVEHKPSSVVKLECRTTK